MKKYHDVVLRNIYKLVVPNDDGEYNDPDIYAELLTSSALPAHCYVAGFKNMKHLISVATNEQNDTYADILYLATTAEAMLLSHSAKRLKMPQAFYDFVVNTFSELSQDLRTKTPQIVHNILDDRLHELIDRFGYTRFHELLEEYEVEHPLPSSWYNADHDPLDVEYHEQWQAYFKFRKANKITGYWRYRAVFEMLLKQLMRIIKKEVQA